MRLIQFLLILLVVMWIFLSIMPVGEDEDKIKAKKQRKIVVSFSILFLTIIMGAGLYILDKDGRDQDVSIKLLKNKVVNNKIYLTDENIKHIDPDRLGDFILKNKIKVIDVYQFNNLNLGHYSEYWPDDVDVIIRDTLNQQVKNFFQSYKIEGVKYQDKLLKIDNIKLNTPDESVSYLNDINFFDKIIFKNINLNNLDNNFWYKFLNNKGLKNLSLINCSIDDSDFDTLLPYIFDNNLVKLNLWGNHISDISLDGILRLFDGNLKRIDLGQNKLSESVVLKIIEKYKLSSKVSYLNINNSNLSLNTREIITNLNKLRSTDIDKDD